MNREATKLPERIETALETLKTYNNGSHRPKLIDLDQVVGNAARHPQQTKAIAARLASVLAENPAVPAAQYICGKLALLGTVEPAKVLVRFLSHPGVAADARTALEAIADPDAGRAIVRELPRLQGMFKAGAIASLGARRDVVAVRALADILHKENGLVRKAAAGALGQIGNSRAAAVLEKFYRSADETAQAELKDALLVCAERLESTYPEIARKLRNILT